MDDPFGFLDLKINKIIKYEGEIYDCIHVFLTRTYLFDTINNCFFEHKICIDKQHPEIIKQTIMAKGLFNNEILLR